MIIVKPDWVIHADEKKKKLSILSVDIHPDGKRFATAGLDFKIKIWNMAPLRDAALEEADDIPKSLCVLSRHDGAVNCIRWSNGQGTYLASGSDDKVVMIWQLNQHSGVVQNSAFCAALSDGAPTIENWTCVQRLTGHSGDVMDLAWSPDNRYLATCGLDHFVCVWDTNSWQLVHKLHGHQSFVKGVTWDPVGKYLASQSDDCQVRIWRVSDWKVEKIITGAYENAVGGTAFFCRLSWSPDGGSLATVQAFNNSLPVSAVLSRDQWDASLARSLVGHSGAIVVARFNPVVFDSSSMSTICAIGSKDDSISVWSSSQPRPIAVAKSLFEQSVLDIAWAQDGYYLLACSYDGSIAYLHFSQDEFGQSVASSDVDKLLEKYGSKRRDYVLAETPDQLLFERSKLNGINSHSSSHATTTLAPKRDTIVRDSKVSLQLESRTKDGKKRITPQLVRSLNDAAPSSNSSIHDIVMVEDHDRDRLVYDAYHKMSQISSLPPPKELTHDIRLDFGPVSDEHFELDKEYALCRPKALDCLSKEFLVEHSSVLGSSQKYLLNAEVTNFGTQVNLLLDGKTVWQDSLPGCKVTFISGSTSLFYAVAAENRLFIYTAKGRRLMPCLVTQAPIHRLDADKQFLSVVLCDASLFVYDISTQHCLHDRLVFPTLTSDRVKYVAIHKETIPIIFLCNETILYNYMMKSWISVTDPSSPYSEIGYKHVNSSKLFGLLQNSVRAQHAPVNSSIAAQCTLAHLEHQCLVAKVLESDDEYRLWMKLYVKKLGEIQAEDKLRELFQEWLKDELGKKLLREMLSVIASLRQMQRLVQEYMDILQ